MAAKPKQNRAARKKPAKKAAKRKPARKKPARKKPARKKPAKRKPAKKKPAKKKPAKRKPAKKKPAKKKPAKRKPAKKPAAPRIPSRFSPMLSSYLVQNPETAWQTLDGEAVIVTPADSKLHTLNETATFIWELCEKGELTVAQIVERLRAEYEVGPVAAVRDVCELAEDLIDKGMAELRDEPGVPKTPWDDLV